MPVQVRVTTQGPTRVIGCQGQGTDLSGGGLAVTADIDLPVGAQIGVEFIPPYSDQPIKFRCFIRNGEGSCYGVEFITENDDDYRKTGELQEGLADGSHTTLIGAAARHAPAVADFTAIEPNRNSVLESLAIAHNGAPASGLSHLLVERV